uniref:Non-specific protein-tyrosine kinase n=1 Tax=Anisakis simplex TaxID=6269 RepID=A0A0M3JXJ2_ANISI
LNMMPPQKRKKKAKKDNTMGEAADVAEILDKRKCEHRWPTPTDIQKLKGKPRSQWIRPEPQHLRDIDCYFGRLPQWYIEEKLLKEPGEFLLSRGHDNKLRLSIKSNEQPDYPCVHLPIEFVQTNQVRGDRNMYYRITNTLVQSRSLWGLIQAYRTSNNNILRQNVKRDVELREEVIPCQGCKYVKKEYSFMFVQVRSMDEIAIGDLICESDRSKIYKATRTIIRKGVIADSFERPIILKELKDYSIGVFDDIYREMHIVNTIRHQIGWDTALNVEAVITLSKPYYIAYKMCKCGSSRKTDPETTRNRRWLAPEVITTKTLTPETDVYAFAWLIYEVFSMKLPFNEVSDENFIGYLAENPDARAEIPSDIPKWLGELVQSAWDSDPAKRPKMVDLWREMRKKNKDVK